MLQILNIILLALLLQQPLAANSQIVHHRQGPGASLPPFAVRRNPTSQGETREQRLASQGRWMNFRDKDLGSNHEHASKAWDAWKGHFSAPRTDTDSYLTDAFRKLHPDMTMTVTISRLFDLFYYAAFPEHEVHIRRRPGSGELYQKVIIPSFRRKDGTAILMDDIRFGEFDVSWKGQTMIVYLATYPNDWSDIRQWFIFTEKGETDAIDLLMVSAGNFATELHDEILVFNTPGFWEKDHALWESVQKANWDDVILNATVKSTLREDVAGFFKKEAVYRELGVPWKRGPPGNGKTISLKALMKEVQEPSLYVKTFKQFGDDQAGIKAIFQQARAEAPCLLILEDLDSLITDENRSFFLNEVDGLENNDGLLILGTTNHFERLDGAIANRPSRFDRKYVFPLPNSDERVLYVKYWQKKLSNRKQIPFPDTLVTKIASLTKGFSFAYLQEAFVASLLLVAGDAERKWEDVLLGEIETLRKELKGGEGDEVHGGG